MKPENGNLRDEREDGGKREGEGGNLKPETEKLKDETGTVGWRMVDGSWGTEGRR